TPEDLHDGIGEIINMISGAAKAVLNEKGNSISIAIPTVIIGFGHQIAHPRDVPVVVLIFEVNEQPFAIQLCISSKKIPMLNQVSKNAELEAV
ncbi:MAG: chemotaxis protein CheX, partial [candidate division Zixibacteria bacterium]|nr:chemotaxis protein CheX [candidate division Zixibacteria bacterium]